MNMYIHDGTDAKLIGASKSVRIAGMLEAEIRSGALERSRIPWRDSFAEIPDKGLPGGSLTAMFRDRGLAVAGGDEWAGVLPSLSAGDAEVMGRMAGEPMLRLCRLTRASDGSVIEYVESILDADLFGLHMEF